MTQKIQLLHKISLRPYDMKGNHFHNSDCYRLSFIDFIDQLCETLMSNVPDAIIVFKTKCNELMASVLPRINCFPLQDPCVNALMLSCYCELFPHI